jgi:hypothetical protein
MVDRERERILKVTQVRFKPVILARTTEPVSDSPHRPQIFSVMTPDCFIFPALKHDNIPATLILGLGDDRK